MCSSGRSGQPVSLSDWYCYLNCGYFCPAVGGTDKMSATTAVGIIRTYARIPDGTEFSYDAWKNAIRSGNTFVTYGPLLEFAVEGKPAGSHVRMPASGGTVEVEYELASVALPMTRLDLVINGEIRESTLVGRSQARGSWSVRLERSSWIALLVRGRHPDRAEMIAAHSSPVMVDVEDSPFLAQADAVTILEQIERAIAYLDTVGTRPGERAHKRMRMILTSARRRLHNRMHRAGLGHVHATPQHHNGHD